MLTDKAMRLIERARERAFSMARDHLDLESILAAMGADGEARVRLADCLTGGDTGDLRRRCPEMGAASPCPGRMEPHPELRALLETAVDLASGEGVPDRAQPGLIGLEHLVCAVAMSRAAVKTLGADLAPIKREEALRLLSGWLLDLDGGRSLGDLVALLRGLRADLLSKVFGQDHAVQAFVEGLYNAGVTAAADTGRKRPEGIFVFAGPPGVGKTYLAELAAARLKRPFRRFDMTAYSDHQAHIDLVGFAESYRGAQPGRLTGFVDANPTAILLFDEIEKAHLNTTQLFYQILDAGRLEDKFGKKEVAFRDTLIIFTTNAGRSLYDNPNRMGIGAANAVYHKCTILSALENERNPGDGRPAFPPAICSRLGQGYPVMFNHLGVNELEKIVHEEMVRVEALLERQYFKSFRHEARLPMSLVYREGARADARQLRAEAERYVKAELFRFCSLYARERIEEALEDIDEVVYSVGRFARGEDPDIEQLYEPLERPKVLLAADGAFGEVCRERVTQFSWLQADTPVEAMEKLALEDVDFVLLDLWLGSPADDAQRTADYVALEARELDRGREMLRRLHERFPMVPVYLLSFTQDDAETPEGQDLDEEGPAGSYLATHTFEAGYATDSDPALGDGRFRRPIDSELLLACMRAGGARGLVSTGFGMGRKGRQADRARQFAQSLSAIHHRLYREKRARILARERKALSFDTTADVDRAQRRLTFSLRNFRLTRALEASDAGALVDDVMRPSTRFDDVLGAADAKQSMQFIVDWLRDTKRYAALGLRPPKGVLMAGPPGTGKTMLARAVAGESDCAFLEKSATSFVTMWQGSGPQNIRDLFARARRYAPAIVFIDEIDAIGKERTGGPSGRAREETLNALLTEMDGFGADSDASPVIVLAATNMADLLDEALRRRFDRVVEVDRPDREARLTYLRRAMASRRGADVSEETLTRLAGQSAGMTIANLERVVQEAGVMAAQEGAAISDALLEEAFEKVRMGAARGPSDPDTLKRVARHEAGHALVAWRGGNKPVQVTIVGRGGAGGFMERESDEDRLLYTKPQIEQLVREAMGGRAAELLYYGDDEGLSTGVGSDLSHATRWAVRMVQEFGMDSDIGQIAVRDVLGNHGGDGPLSAQVAQQARRVVDEQLKKAVELLAESRTALDALVEGLLRKNRLTREDMERLLDGLP